MKSQGRLLDCAGVVREFGVSRSVAEKWMRQLPKVQTPGVRKVWVYRADVDRYVKEHTKAA